MIKVNFTSWKIKNVNALFAMNIRTNYHNFFLYNISRRFDVIPLYIRILYPRYQPLNLARVLSPVQKYLFDLSRKLHPLESGCSNLLKSTDVVLSLFCVHLKYVLAEANDVCASLV